jgi:predicted ArsR family transcriptional regulator
VKNRRSKPSEYAEAALIVADCLALAGGPEEFQAFLHQRLKKAAQEYGKRLESIVINLLAAEAKRRQR